MKGLTRIIISFIFICSIHYSTAQNHHLDDSFGVGGTVMISQGSFANITNSMAIQNDDKILYGGYWQDTFKASYFGLFRCHSDGRQDFSFGWWGSAIQYIENSSKGQAIALQKDGKILIGGRSQWFINLARFTEHGSIDSSFGNGGKLIVDVEGFYSERCEALVVQDDGKIVVAGYGQHSSNDQSYLIVLRYTSNGELDSSFGTGGLVIGNKGTVKSAIIQKDGKIVLAGTRSYTFFMTRYLEDGSLDTSFGTEGEVLTSIGNTCEVGAMVLQSDGKIILGGYTRPGFGFSDFAMARYQVNGDLDNSFGTDGISITSMGIGNSKCNALALQDDGKIIMAGEAKSDTNVYDFAAARFNSDGALDNSFGTNGKILTPIGPSYSSSTSVGIQKDGKLVLGGYGYDGTKNFMILARYNTPTPTGSASFNRPESNWIVYPNPFQTTAIIRFQDPVNNAAISLYNNLGQCVKQINNVSGLEYSLSRDNLAKGLYFLHIIEGKNRVSTQTVVIH